ncbi:BppU family phage baseplate upper protein [Enterococcus faecium]|uniref:BppU family phage baseplate upper protein n=1 Tax=Enterococcus faecium TaxID=1352 RepID=UPI002890FAFF|nr:BppU family phage baseplate upper protein [Enterococcus faecium]MDT2349886.1 BppU family phage baseplate upper protein [Enterococcus faecium]
MVKPQVSGRVEGRSDYVFYSFDKESAQFIIAFVDANDKPLDLLNANPTVLLIIEEDGKQKKFVLDGTDMKEVSIIDGKVAFIIPDFLLGYRGKVEMYIGVTFADGSSSDELHLAFTMKESPFNAAYEEAKNYYVANFEMLLHEVELAKTTAINDINKQLPEIKKKLSDVESRIEIAEQNIDEVMEKTELHEMYSNSIEFGDYDYSGNPNLIANINADSFSQGIGALSVVDDGDEVVITLDPNSTLSIYKVNSQPFLLVGKTYTMSVEIMLEDDFTGDPSKIALSYLNLPNKVPALTTLNTLTTAKGVWQKLTVTAKMTATINNAKSWYITLYNQDANNSLSGRLRLRHAKLEVGSTATPYQPNLLDAPYYLSKVPLGENIANKSVTFPIKTSAYAVYSYNNTENFIVGEKYVLTIKARKSATQTFNVRNVSNVFGDMKPVEGLTDIWVLEFTPTSIDKTYPAMLDIYQIPSNNVDACQIEWLKIEKGDTRTPNIEQYKYRGIGMRDSNNPKDYVWELAPEYVEDNLATDVKISEITGKANKYTDNAIAAVNTNVVNVADDLAKQINTNKSAAESYADTKKTEAVNESKKYTDEAITNITPNRTSLRIESGFSDGFTGWVTFERIGDIVIVSYALSPKENSGTWKTPLPIASIPEEFRFNSNAYSTGSIATSNISNDVCQVGMNEQGLQFASWNRTAGIAQFAGQVTGAVKSREK